MNEEVAKTVRPNRRRVEENADDGQVRINEKGKNRDQRDENDRRQREKWAV